MNIKRFLSGALCAVLLLALCPTAAADAPCEISSAEELSLLRETPDGDFVLTADIDMTGVDWQPIAFSGTLDGGGHTIYNLTVTSLGADRAETVDGNDKTYDTALTGFFSVLSGASVRDLSLRGVNIAVETPENVFAGTLAGFASPETVLENGDMPARTHRRARPLHRRYRRARRLRRRNVYELLRGFHTRFLR